MPECVCGRPTRTPKSTYCDDADCARVRARERKRESRRPTLDPPPEPERHAGGVFSATLDELTRAGRVATPSGQIALALATRIDFGVKDTGSSIAAVSKQHSAAMAEAMKDLAVADDPVDELKQRRSARAG